MKNNNYNIVWLFIDGVRRYHSKQEQIDSGDDRSRLQFMDEFAKKSVEIKNVVTSAPSTFQSLSAMLTGLDSYIVNRNFADFIFEKNVYKSLTTDLENSGYSMYSFLMHPSMREVMSNFYKMIDRKYWPNNFSHSDWWDNSDINLAVNKFLKIGFNEPAFIFVDYNCRKDSETSNKVKIAFNKFEEAGFNDSNTIFILCSDHGYPDFSKESGRPEFYTKNNLTHDVILTDDNIMIPMFIKYPGCPEGKKVNSTVSSLDLYPTILDLLEMPIPENIIGRSWIPLINENAKYIDKMNLRYHRSDSRMHFQPGRSTVIRNHSYKYTFHHDKKHTNELEEFHDLINDKYETKNLINDKNDEIIYQINTFRKEFDKSEKRAFDFQLKYLHESLLTSKNKKILNEIDTVLILETGNKLFIEILTEILIKINSNLSISILRLDNFTSHQIKNIKYLFFDIKTFNKKDFKDNNQLFANDFDMLFIPYNINEGRDYNSIFKIAKKISFKNKMIIDYNMKSYKSTLKHTIQKYSRKIYWLKYEPINLVITLFKEIIIDIKRIKHKVNKK
jgi:hypothetical protein